jgi:hypothetical protein
MHDFGSAADMPTRNLRKLCAIARLEHGQHLFVIFDPGSPVRPLRAVLESSLKHLAHLLRPSARLSGKQAAETGPHHIVGFAQRPVIGRFEDSIMEGLIEFGIRPPLAAAEMLDHLPMSTLDAAETFLVDASASEFAGEGFERSKKRDGLVYLLVRDANNGRTLIGQNPHQAFGR